MSSGDSMMIDEEVESAGGESSIDELDHMMEEDDESSSEDNTPLQYNYEYIPDKQHTVSNDAKQRERIHKIEDAATNIQRVIQKYDGDASLPSINPDDIDNKKGSWDIDKSSPWANPSLAIKEIITAREELCKAWDRDDVDDGERGSGELMDGINAQQLEEEKDKWWKSVLHKEDNRSKEIDSGRSHINNVKDETPPLTKEEDQQFKEIYMEWATNAYSVELNALREGELSKLTSARRKQKNTAGSAGSKNDKSAVELDPTQYSFIVESNKRRDTKKEVEQVDVKVLGDMMSSGSYALSNTEKRMLLQARQRAIETADDNTDTDTDAGIISLHERRKLELGF